MQNRMQLQSIDVTTSSGLSTIIYDLNARLGAGSYGVVYRGYVHATKQSIAVKVIPIQTDDVKLYHAEIQNMMLLTNLGVKNVVRFHGYFLSMTDGAIMIAMTYAENGSLHQWLGREPRFNHQLQLSIMIGIANGLAGMHHCKMIHGDIKPENILLDGEMMPLICDFGRAQLLTDDDRPKMDGTPIFIAPEILLSCVSGQAIHNSEASDIYAFSLVCWCIVANKQFPYDEFKSIPRFIKEIMTNDKREVFVPEMACPPSLVTIISQCWDREPAKRPSAIEAKKALSKVNVYNDDELSCVPFFNQLFSFWSKPSKQDHAHVEAKSAECRLF